MDDDEDLHVGMILLDPDALARWQDKYGPAIIGWLQKGGLTTSDAEEVWNDVFAATVAAAPRLEPRGVSIRRYAFRVARNLRADLMRSRGRIQTTELTDSIAVGASVNQTPTDPRKLDALRACLVAAPPRYRSILELTQEGSDVQRLAVEFDIDPESVHQLRRRARKWLASCIEGKLDE